MPRASVEDARRLARLSNDCSFLLTHMIRQNTRPPRSDEAAKKILLSILGVSGGKPPVLKAGRVGWYSSVSAAVFDPEQDDFVPSGESRAVCFTESTLAGLQGHRDVFRVKYGLSFDRDWLFGRGANPCLNIRGEVLKATVERRPHERYTRKVFNYIPPGLHPFINVINEAFDATHEREWRYPEDLMFKYGDIRFVFCPEREFHVLSKIQRAGKPTLFDLEWLDRV